jgi:imidazolonepropionase-like amidohydrolase
MTARHMAIAAERGIPVVPTLLQVSLFESFAAQADGKFPRFAARMRRMHGRRHEQVRAMHEAGVSMFLGTDAGTNIGHGSLPDEAAEMVTAGVPAADVVAQASWRARAFLGVPTLTEGESADLVVFGADPRGDIRALGRPAHIVLRGRRVAGHSIVA